MKHGRGWIIFEESYPESVRKLLSILPARRTPNQVAAFIEQIYIDSYTTIAEQIAYKKSSRSAIYGASIDPMTCIIHCGDNPWLVGIYARSISLIGNYIQFAYKILADASDPLNPVFAERHQTLSVDA